MSAIVVAGKPPAAQFGSKREQRAASSRMRTGRARWQSAKRLVVHSLNPQLADDATDETPVDLASYLYSKRIVYLGMTLVPEVTELIVAELTLLDAESTTKPIYMYINSTGVAKGVDRLGYEHEAFAIYDVMRMVRAPIYTVCVGSAFGEAALLLASGAPGRRAALPSATMMIREPIRRLTQMQATDIDISRKAIRHTNATMARLLAKHTGHSIEKVSEDIRRIRYFSAQEAVDYHLIDQVLVPREDVQKQVSAIS